MKKKILVIVIISCIIIVGFSFYYKLNNKKIETSIVINEDKYYTLTDIESAIEVVTKYVENAGYILSEVGNEPKDILTKEEILIYVNYYENKKELKNRKFTLERNEEGNWIISKEE